MRRSGGPKLPRKVTSTGGGCGPMGGGGGGGGGGAGRGGGGGGGGGAAKRNGSRLISISSDPAASASRSSCNTFASFTLSASRRAPLAPATAGVAAPPPATFGNS